MSEIITPSKEYTDPERVRFLKLFRDKEASGDPDYAGYESLAKDAIGDLDLAAARAKSGNEATRHLMIELGLRPDGDPYHFIEGKEREGTKALMSSIYMLAGNAEKNVIKHEVTHKATGKMPENSQIILRGRWENQDIYFVETHSYGAVDIKLAAELTDELLSFAKNDQQNSGLSREEKIDMWNETMDEIDDYPTARVDEAEIVKNSVKHRKV